MFQFPGRQYFEMDGVHIKLKVSGLRAFHSLVNNRKSVARQYPSCTNTLKESGDAVRQFVGTIRMKFKQFFVLFSPY